MYFKGFASIYDGTLTSNGPWEALVTFQQFLFLADREGVVDMNAAAISRRTTVPLSVIERGIIALEAEDPLSRRPNDSGCRLRRLDDHRDWGWQIVNFAFYQDLLSAEQKREYNRNYQQERRSKFGAAAKPKDVNVDKVDSGTQLSGLSMSRQEEVEEKEEVKKPPVRKKTPHGVRFEEFWATWPKHFRKQDKAKCKKKWDARELDKIADDIIAHVKLKQLTEQWQREGGQFIEAPLTYINGSRWGDGAPDGVTNSETYL